VALNLIRAKEIKVWNRKEISVISCIGLEGLKDKESYRYSLVSQTPPHNAETLQMSTRC
jgi:hypothetical protein